MRWSPLLRQILEQGNRGDNNLCIILDRHKAIDKACSELWPMVGRRYCTKHLSVNFKKMFPGPKMWKLFWLAAGAYSNFIFEKEMKQIDKHRPGARLWVANLGEQERWSKHKFNPNLKSDVNKIDCVENFNAAFGIDRTRPVLTLLEGIRKVIMVRMTTRRELCNKWDIHDICPKIVKRVQMLCTDFRTYLAYLSAPSEYEIVDGKSTLQVSLNHHTCKCNQWQLIGIPCKHGMRAILNSNLDPLKFVHEWYYVKRYKMAYGNGIRPITDRE
ncbi:Central glycolytic genes regulator [Bienertia sinuspersici]